MFRGEARGEPRVGLQVGRALARGREMAGPRLGRGSAFGAWPPLIIVATHVVRSIEL